MRQVISLGLWAISLGVLMSLSQCSSDGKKPIGQLSIIEQAKSPYQIIIGLEASAETRKAAEEFRRMVEMFWKVRLPIFTDQEKAKTTEIVFGSTNRGMFEDELQALNDDGYYKTSQGKKLFLIAKNDRALLYGVYDLLERCGIKRVVPSITMVPTSENLYIDGNTYSYNPPFRLRRLDYPEAGDPFFNDYYKLHSSPDFTNAFGSWGYSYEKLLPASRYFNAHPEYFSEINGVRIPNGQLCLSNAEVSNVLIDNLAGYMQMNPTAQYWSVTPNDNPWKCQCNQCQLIEKEEGSYAGLILRVANKIAEAYPGRIILAGVEGMSLNPPKTKPTGGVTIVISNRSCNKSKAIAADDDPSNQNFRQALDGWIALAGDRIILWDHTIQHTHLVSPFPNLRTLAPNLRFYRDKGLKNVFMEGYHSEGGELSELRRYMLAKLLWNPDENTDTLIHTFCQNFYGSAAVPMLNYINLLQTQLEASGETLTSDHHPSQGLKSYFRPEYMDQYNYFFNQAEELGQNDPQLRDRIKLARLAQAYATLDLARASATGTKGFYMNVNNKWIVVPGLRTFTDNFVSECERMNVTLMNSAGMTPQDFRRDIFTFLDQSVNGHKAFRKIPQFTVAPSMKYAGGSGEMVVDGIMGAKNFANNYVGWSASDLVATLDLGNTEMVNSISLTFLQNLAANIWLPTSVKFEVSADGNTYQSIGQVNASTGEKTIGPLTQNFQVRPGKSARYLRITAANRGTCPDWHFAAGEPAWIFTDEIVVQ